MSRRSPPARHRKRLRTAALLLLLGLLGCTRQGAPWQLKDIAGLMPPLQFELTDANTGRQVNGSDFHGSLLLLYFGYTHCPDVCPTTLAKLQQAVSQLGPAGAEVRILFVSVDPARDSVADLKRYAAAFGPAVVGMRGTPQALRELTRRYRITFGYGKPDANGDYEVSHSSAVYIFDRQGQARLLARPDDSATTIAGDLGRLAAEHG